MMAYDFYDFFLAVGTCSLLICRSSLLIFTEGEVGKIKRGLVQIKWELIRIKRGLVRIKWEVVYTETALIQSFRCEKTKEALPLFRESLLGTVKSEKKLTEIRDAR